MVIGLVTIRVSIPEARSLKDKRSVIRSLKDRVLHRMNVSVAEVGEQDQWRFSQMAFVTVGADSAIVQKRISDLSALLRGDPRYVLLDLHTELM